MSGAILQEIRFFLVSAAFGMLIGLSYDVLRIFRRLVRHGVWWVALEDLLFCLAASLVTFSMVFTENNGALRFFSLGSLALGAFLYYISVSRLLVFLAVRVVRFPFRILFSGGRQVRRIGKKMLDKTRKIR